ncbi:MAG: transposase family protein [Nitrospirota bacterium]|nr:transposase family protein [Nitrospirota bacterium]
MRILAGLPDGKIRRLLDVYQFPGYVRRPRTNGDLVIQRVVLSSWSGDKSVCGCCGTMRQSFYDSKTRRIRDLSCGDVRVYLEVTDRRVSEWR